MVTLAGNLNITVTATQGGKHLGQQNESDAVMSTTTDDKPAAGGPQISIGRSNTTPTLGCKNPVQADQRVSPSGPAVSPNSAPRATAPAGRETATGCRN